MLKTKMLLIVIFATSLSLADTFTNKKTKESFDGFATTKKMHKLTVVRTSDNKPLKINLKDYDIALNNKGRRDLITVIPLHNAIEFSAETDAFCKAIEKNVNKGVKLIIIDVDSPGGSVSLCIKMCKFIMKMKKLCPIVAYVSSGEINGAISAAAGVCLACPSIYMSPKTTIGAATPFIMTKYGIVAVNADFRHGFSQFYGELARKNGKPMLIAMAMVDMNFDVTEYKFDNKSVFVSKKLKIIDPKPEDSTDNPDKTLSWNPPKDAQVVDWSKDKKLITLVASDALKVGICDGIMDSKYALVDKLGLSGTKLVIDKSPMKARRDIKVAKKRVDTTIVRIERRIVNFNHTRMTYKEAVTQLNKMTNEVHDAIGLSKKYPEIRVNRKRLHELNDQLESILKRL